MILLTLSGQILVFIIFFKDKRLQTPNNYYIISLALADLLISVTSLPFWTIFTAIHYWPFSQLLCDIWSSWDYALSLISVHTILFISVERFRSVSDPIKHKVFLTARRMKICLISIWLANLAFWTTYVFVTQHFYAKIRNPMDCSLAYLTEPILAIFVGIYILLPVVVTAVTYILIFRIAQRAGVIKSTNRTNPSLSDKSCSVSVATVSTTTSAFDKELEEKEKNIQYNTKFNKGAKEDKEKKALKTIALLLVTFSICWVPVAFVFIIEGIAPGYLDIIWLVAGYWLGYSNSTFNPICFALGNPYFRETFSKFLCKYKK